MQKCTAWQVYFQQKGLTQQLPLLANLLKIIGSYRCSIQLFIYRFAAILRPGQSLTTAQAYAVTSYAST